MKRILPALMIVSFAAMAVAQPHVGINLSGAVDWNSELPFVDVFRLARTWISQREGAGWGEGPALDLDEHGWVRSLQPGCHVDAPMCTIDAGRYPAGRYTVLYEGSGHIDVWGRGKVVQREPGRLTVEVGGDGGALFLRITETDPRDYVRNIHVILPGHGDTWRQQPFRPGFLAQWRGFACYRFMDWAHTNGSVVRTWADRPQVEDAVWTVDGKGVPVEVMVDLCNRQGVAPWFCMPHQADDDYVRRFATRVHETLDPKLAVYVEYSNEVWNGIFPQHRYAAERGQALGLAEKPWEAAWAYYAVRSTEIFRIWREVFGEDAGRLVCVLATQSANPYVTERILAVDGAAEAADALGVAPYFGPIVGPDRVEEVLSMGAAGLLEHVASVTLPETIGHIRAQKALADRHGLRLAAYEAGQHLVGTGGAENDERLTALLHEANRHPRMGELYATYLAAWADAGGDVIAMFSSVGTWSKWGSWGLMQYCDDVPAEQPKMRAVLEYARRQGQPVGR